MSDAQFEKGRAIMGSVLGSVGAKGIEDLTKISPMHGRAVLEYCFGTVWAEPHLPIKIKEFILIAVCAGQGEYEAVERQVRGAINQGATREEVIEALTTCAPYIGYPRTNASLRVAQRVFEEWDQHPEWKGV
jgi:4-carboxymuconolactone decarboxylase